MSAVPRITAQLIYGSGLQRWLLRIGLVLTVLGFVAFLSDWRPQNQPLFTIVGVLGIALTVISPILVGAVMFRALSAPRAVRLIPRGRLQLAQGAFCTQLLLALFITAAVSISLCAGPAPHAALADRTAAGLVFAIFTLAWGALTLLFLSFYWGLQHRFTAFLWVAWVFIPPLLSHAFPQLHAGAMLATPVGLACVLSASLLAWPLFAAIYIRQRHIRIAPARAHPASAPRRYTAAQAVGVLLNGPAKVRTLMIVTALIVVFLFLLGLLIGPRGNGRGSAADAGAVMVCLLGAVLPAALTGIATRRARSLWLTARMNREQLFAAVEQQSWGRMLPVAATAMALAIAILAFTMSSLPPPTLLLRVVALPLAAGALLIYVGLMSVSGPGPDILLHAAYTVLLLIEMILAVTDSSALPALLGAQLILLPLLRQIAQRRWRGIDWVVHKVSATQLTG